jgi:hypothetical protein
MVLPAVTLVKGKRDANRFGGRRRSNDPGPGINLMIDDWSVPVLSTALSLVVTVLQYAASATVLLPCSAF